MLHQNKQWTRLFLGNWFHQILRSLVFNDALTSKVVIYHNLLVPNCFNVRVSDQSYRAKYLRQYPRAVDQPSCSSTLHERCNYQIPLEHALLQFSSYCPLPEAMKTYPQGTCFDCRRSIDMFYQLDLLVLERRLTFKLTWSISNYHEFQRYIHVVFTCFLFK